MKSYMIMDVDINWEKFWKVSTVPVFNNLKKIFTTDWTVDKEDDLVPLLECYIGDFFDKIEYREILKDIELSERKTHIND